VFCANCGNEVQEGERSCVRCGAATEVPAQGTPTTTGTSPGSRGTASPQLSFNASRLKVGDLVAAGGTFLVLITLFLPWYSASCAATGSIFCQANQSAHLSALGAHSGGWRFLILVLVIITLGYLAARALLPNEVRLAVEHWQIVTGLTAATALLVLVSLFTNPFSPFRALGISASPGFGSIIGIIAALVAVAGGVMLRTATTRTDQVA